MLGLDTIIGFIAEQAGTQLLNEAARREAVQRVLKRAKIPLEPTSDFESIYTHALIAYGIGRPPDLLDLFRHELVRNAYRATFEQRDPQIFRRDVEAFLQSAEGQQLYGMDYDPRRELDIFHARFLDLADRVRTVPEIRRDQQLADIQDTSQAILATLKTPTESPTRGHLPMPPRVVDKDMLETAQIKRTTIPHDQVPAMAPLEPNSVMPFHHNRAFVGRQDALRYVAQHLRDSTTPGAALVLTGMGGIGKTQLASEIVHRYGPFFAGGVFWLACADPAIVPGEIAACGARGLVDWRPDYLSLSQEEQIQLVLSAWQSPLPRLLVFDNCEDPALLTQWRPTTGGCVVLVTSRRATWPTTMGVTVYPLEVLQRSESNALLRYFRPDLVEDDPDLDAVAEELGDLPLALHLAGSYLAVMRHAVTPAAYLAEVQAPNLLAHPSLEGWELATDESPTQHTQHVARTFALSYRQLDTTTPRDQAARKLLACAAAGAPGEIFPRTVLYAILQHHKQPVGQHEQEVILRRLINLGLLEEIGNGGLRVHRLLIAFVQEQNDPENGDDIPYAEELIYALIAVADQYKEQGVPMHIVELHPHLRQVSLMLIHSERVDPLWAYLCHSVAHHCGLINDYTIACPLYKHTIALQEQLHGPTHLDVASSLNDLAELLREQRKYTDAQPLQERALAIREHISGPNHPDTAFSLNNLALLLFQQGNYAAARPLLERALTVKECVFGWNHPDTATGLNNLAVLLQEQGDYAAAQSLFEQALTIYKQNNGFFHPNTAACLNNMGLFYDKQGDYAAARPFYEQALAICEQSLGLQHLNTAMSLTNLAQLLQKQGDYTTAYSFFEQALTIYEQVHGTEHPDTARGMSDLAELLRIQGNHTAAQPLLEHVLSICVQMWGDNHPDVARILTNMGEISRIQENYSAAYSFLERALTIHEQFYGPEHLATAASIHNLASLYYTQGDYSAARPLYERALIIAEQELGLNHDNTVLVRSCLTACIQNISDH